MKTYTDNNMFYWLLCYWLTLNHMDEMVGLYEVDSSRDREDIACPVINPKIYRQEETQWLFEYVYVLSREAFWWKAPNIHQRISYIHHVVFDLLSNPSLPNAYLKNQFCFFLKSSQNVWPQCFDDYTTIVLRSFFLLFIPVHFLSHGRTRSHWWHRFRKESANNIC
jgi:hypothetical protein